MVELPNRFFGDYNPYALNISGGWLLYGQWLHRGDVYLDGEAFREQKGLEEVKQREQSWCCQAAEDNTTIWANFGKANPNTQLAEINVRESVFMPAESGLKYITVDGFHLLHSAENWQPPGLHVADGNDRPAHGQALDHRELHRHQCPLRGHLTRARARRGLRRHRRLRRAHRPQQRDPPLR